MLLVVELVWKVNGRAPTSNPVEPQLFGGRAENKLVALTDEAGKVSNLQPFGGRLGDGDKYTLLGITKMKRR